MLYGGCCPPPIYFHVCVSTHNIWPIHTWPVEVCGKNWYSAFTMWFLGMKLDEAGTEALAHWAIWLVRHLCFAMLFCLCFWLHIWYPVAAEVWAMLLVASQCSRVTSDCTRKPLYRSGSCALTDSENTCVEVVPFKLDKRAKGRRGTVLNNLYCD